MSPSQHSDTNPDLWVEVTGYPGRLYIMGNPHTYPGRVVAWNYERDESLYFSRDEVVASSDAARWWLEGYLHGSEPELEEYLGIDSTQIGDIDDDDPRVDDWRQAIATFHDTGAMPREFYERIHGPIDPATE